MKRRISILLLLCWLFATALAGSPALHEWLHGADAGHGDHECVVNLISGGGVESPNTPLIAVAAPMLAECGILPVRDAEVPAIFLSGSLSDRGPPVMGA